MCLILYGYVLRQLINILVRRCKIVTNTHINRRTEITNKTWIAMIKLHKVHIDDDILGSKPNGVGGFIYLNPVSGIKA